MQLKLNEVLLFVSCLIFAVISKMSTYHVELQKKLRYILEKKERSATNETHGILNES